MEDVVPSEVYVEIKGGIRIHDGGAVVGAATNDAAHPLRGVGKIASTLGRSIPTTSSMPCREPAEPVGDGENDAVVEMPTCCWCKVMPGTRPPFALRKIYELDGILCPMCDEALSLAGQLKEYATPYLDKELAVLITSLISAVSLAIEKVLEDKMKKMAMRRTLEEATITLEEVTRLHDGLEGGRVCYDPGLRPPKRLRRS